MDIAGIIKQFRLDRDDLAEGVLWSDAEIRTYLNSAIDEVCERALLIEDRSTAACCSISLVADQGAYPLHKSVIRVKRVTWNGLTLSETSEERLDFEDRYWETRKGRPMEYVLKNQSEIRLVSAPNAAAITQAGTIALTVYRTQLTPIDEDTDDEVDLETLIGIPAIYHLRMLPWMYALALRKNDTQTLNKDEADRQEAIFVAAFGQRPDANVQRKRRDKRPARVRFQW